MQVDNYNIILGGDPTEKLKQKRKLKELGTTERKMFGLGLIDEEGELTNSGIKEYVNFLYSDGLRLEDFWEYLEDLLDE